MTKVKGYLILCHREKLNDSFMISDKLINKPTPFNDIDWTFASGKIHDRSPPFKNYVQHNH